MESFDHSQAKRYLSMLSDKIEIIAENPSFGIDYDFVIDGLRRYESSSHSIYYKLMPTGIRVLRILHGRIDPAQHIK
ncbi:MAG: type II toxin-antitoxin system RelE/ParE family toxin [Gammaproteobacteria bacterium]|nr:type II toxin-antitoxin system RelE/ParE family toxin [Gammaproteobacteria bacterium]MCY4219799.1 type II toxin-antitoxin system RelE/ParE family toxin [Gammaproteobacteria bacterium]